MTVIETFYNHEQIRSARTADLFRYMLDHHASDVKREGTHLYLVSNRSVRVHSGVPGFHDFSTEEKGNSLEFLQKYLGYTFTGAVGALTSVPTCLPDVENPKPLPSIDSRDIILPVQAGPPYRQLYAYLSRRGIPGSVISMLIKRGLLYQEAEHNNAVFLSERKDCYELKGTYTFGGTSFKQVKRAAPECCWYFCGSAEKPAEKRVYICEAAIDAISLFVLHTCAGIDRSFVYASLAGVYNQKPVERFIREGYEVVIAVDNDHAGEQCRRRNGQLRSTIPVSKDWNEDLMNGSFVRYFK